MPAAGPREHLDGRYDGVREAVGAREAGASPRRYHDLSYVGFIAPDICGEAVRSNPGFVRDHMGVMKARGSRGYYYQLLAGTGWTNLRWLRKLRQPALIIPSASDPIILVSNAKIMVGLIPNSRLHVVDGGTLPS